ncbi:hypothetical protein D3OALGA1CA_3217 [Olavius algarvensis associated proteobacterium Delta 3]|nr:hypothetical protein D3OALGA1CA_3217 [Olavius algarvensis associated proteobacterium Delta 3]
MEGIPVVLAPGCLFSALASTPPSQTTSSKQMPPAKTTLDLQKVVIGSPKLYHACQNGCFSISGKAFGIKYYPESVHEIVSARIPG